MKIKAKDICIRLIYLFSFIYALTYIYYGLMNSYRWRIISSLPVFAILFLSAAYLLFSRFLRVEYMGILLFLMVVYELVASAISGMFIMPNILMDVIAWPLLFWVFYDYSKKNEIPKNAANRLTIVGMTFICVLAAYSLLRRFFFGVSSGSQVFTTYFTFSLLPFVYLYCSKKASAFFSAVVAALMIISMKRAAFIIVVVGISAYYMISNYIAGERGKKLQRMFVTMFGLLVLGALAWFMIDRFNIGVLKRLTNTIEDGGSGRTRIWAMILSGFENSSIKEKVIGHGFHSVPYEVRPFGKGIYAHNSLLETLYDYGIVGVVLLVFLILHLLAKTIKMIKVRFIFASVMSYTVISMLVLGAVSYFFEESVMTIPHVMVWGICMGRFVRAKQRNWHLVNGWEDMA